MSDGDVAALISRLVSIYFPRGATSDRQQKFYESYCKTLLTSSLRPSGSFASNPLLHSPNSNIKQYAETIARSDELKHSQSILYVLHELACDVQHNVSYLPSSLLLPSLDKKKSMEDKDEEMEEQQGETGDSFDDVPLENFTTEPVSEDELVQSCITAIQGIDSKLINWQRFEIWELEPFAEKPNLYPLEEEQDSDEETDVLYEEELKRRNEQRQIENDILDRHCQVQKRPCEALRITPHYRYGSYALPSSQLELVEKICYTGTLYIRIRNCITSSGSRGLVLQSLIESINSYIRDYYQAISELMPGMTLRALFVWSLPYTNLFERLFLVLREITRTRSTGGQILTILYSLGQHGNPEVNQTMSHLLQASTVPFYKMIQQWLFCGEIEDLFGEFFVSRTPNASSDIWNSFTLRQEMIPSFISLSLAQRILCVGKSIDFLRNSCQQQVSLLGNHSGILASVTSSSSLQNLSKLVTYSERTFNRKAVQVLVQVFQLIENCSVLKRFLFFEQGNFAHSLLHEMSEELNQPADKIFLHRLRSQLESALLMSVTQRDNNEIIKQIRVALNRKGTGWDAFHLSFSTEAPLTMTFTSEIVQKYENISKFLWQLKRVEFALIINRRNYPLKCLPFRELYKFHVVHNHMLRFINDLQFCFMHDSINSAWNLFLQKLNKAQSLDHVHAAHLEYLNAIIRDCLLSNDRVRIMGTITRICKIALDFRTFQNALYGQVHSFQQLYKSQLEPSLEVVDLTKKRDFIRCSKLIPQYQEQLRNLTQAVKQEKIAHLYPVTKIAKLHL